MNVAYEIDFDIESFLKSMDREARTAGRPRAGSAGVARRYAGRDRTAQHDDGGFGPEQRARGAQV